jgi:hypothetical protein
LGCLRGLLAAGFLLRGRLPGRRLRFSRPALGRLSGCFGLFCLPLSGGPAFGFLAGLRLRLLGRRRLLRSGQTLGVRACRLLASGFLLGSGLPGGGLLCSGLTFKFLPGCFLPCSFRPFGIPSGSHLSLRFLPFRFLSLRCLSRGFLFRSFLSCKRLSCSF